MHTGVEGWDTVIYISRFASKTAFKLFFRDCPGRVTPSGQKKKSLLPQGTFIPLALGGLLSDVLRRLVVLSPRWEFITQKLAILVWGLCFFTIHCNPSQAYIAVRDLQSSQRNESVQSLLLAGNFLYNQ